MRALIVLVMSVTLLGCGNSDPELKRFVAAKRAQTHELAGAQTNQVPAAVWKFFDAVKRNDWNGATNLYAQLQRRSGRFSDTGQPQSPWTGALPASRAAPDSSAACSPVLQTEVWSPICETLGAYEAFHAWDRKWLRRFAHDLIGSIPPGSLYFGGTDPGRFVIAAFSDAHRAGRPFFTVTQNQLADSTYLAYLRRMYRQLNLPTADDWQRAFEDYFSDAQERMRKHQLKPGEDVKIVDNRVQVSGQVAVMQINGLLAKVIVDKNPERQIYVEESFPLDWMYPHLEPHGLILKLNREPLAELGAAVIARDREYWDRYVAELIGGWVNPETTVQEICDFGEKVYLRKELAGFAGDAGFARSAEAQKTFSKLRSAVAGLYAWRAEHASTPGEKQRMTKAADLAFRQALALCPYSPEAVFRYAQLLLPEKRAADARRIAETLLRFEPQNAGARDLLEQVKKLE